MIQQFIEKFADQLLDQENSNLNPETIFRELDDWDSLTAMAVLTMIDDDYHVKIGLSEFKTLTTIGQLYNFIEVNKVNN